MEQEGKLSELNLTAEEMNRFTKAFKDESFRERLRDYAEEISNPENRRKYEEEIASLEQEQGNSVQFLHPTPFRCLRTCVNSTLKGYINICANNKVEKPSCKNGVSENGTRGHHWSLPHSMHPERKDVDPKGNKILIYDVIFHPDTIHMANTNDRFMDMVTSATVKSIQDTFKVRLDRNNITTMRTKYKGNPQACVIRKPIPGFHAKGASEDPDPLTFPHPDTNTSASKKKISRDVQSQAKQFQTTQGPTEPHYTLKYRSFIDLQDFRCSRDSGQSPRPKEIIVTVDLPLLKSVEAMTLEVKEKSLLLESQDPAYKLELSLAYGVDEDGGEAKFLSQTRQLVVRLPVCPLETGLQVNSSPTEESPENTHKQAFSEEDYKEERLERESVSQESNPGEKTGGNMEQEKEDAAPEIQNESNDQSLREGPQEEAEMQDRDGVIDDQRAEVTAVRETEACDTKEAEKQGESERPSKAPIREATKAKSDLQEAPVCAEDPAAEQMHKGRLRSDSAPPVSLREGVPCHQVTPAGFSFHNSLLFELD